MAGAVLDNENLITNAPHWPKIIGIAFLFDEENLLIQLNRK